MGLSQHCWDYYVMKILFTNQIGDKIKRVFKEHPKDRIKTERDIYVWLECVIYDRTSISKNVEENRRVFGEPRVYPKLHVDQVREKAH